MKFAKDQRVRIIASDIPATVLHAFIRKTYAQTDQPTYTVQTASGGRQECAEEELE